MDRGTLLVGELALQKILLLVAEGSQPGVQVA
jgi:hypothetical protein